MSAPGRYDGIMQFGGGSRPVMSRPQTPVATSLFIREVRDALLIVDDDAARNAADWIVQHMEGMGAASARPVFDMDGNGPQCSWCGIIWPLCGHHHTSEVLDEDEDEEGQDDADG